VQAIDIPIGSQFGKLTVIRQANNIGKNRAFLCECECGTLKTVQGRYLRLGTVKSCGCSRKGDPKSAHPLYFIWKGMHKRTTNRKHTGYQTCGALGIRVCERWNDFDNWLEDMGPRPKDTILSRLDQKKDYTPENTRWLTAVQKRAVLHPKSTHAAPATAAPTADV